MSGRAAGYCAGYPNGGFANPMPGRGFGRGPGFGRGGGMELHGRRCGHGRGAYATAIPAYGTAFYGAAPNPMPETEMLKNQEAYYEAALEDTRKRLAELETPTDINTNPGA